MNRLEYGRHIRLWCSVILQAVSDIEEGHKIRYIQALARKRRKKPVLSKYTPEEVADFTEGAERWFDSENVSVGSFQWICDMCELDAEKIRKLTRTVDGRKELLRASAKLMEKRQEAMRELEAETEGDKDE